MPVYILLAIGSVLFVIWIFTKLKNSSKFDKVVKDITEEQPLAEPKTNEVINKIGEAEHALKNRAEADKKESERLEKDAKIVGNFLTDRGVVKVDKPKEGEPTK